MSKLSIALGCLVALAWVGCTETPMTEPPDAATSMDAEGRADAGSIDSSVGPDSTVTGCTEDGECDDDEPCNGAETCGIDGMCAAGVPLAEGAGCSSDAVADGLCAPAADGLSCIPAGCGNELVEPDEDCDDGRNGDDADGCKDDCSFSCATDVDCDDADVCNGMESCDVAAHVCLPASDLDCDDTDACTADACDPLSGCASTLIDADGDGHASTTLGACGGDCDDAAADVFPGAVDTCDGVDTDCDMEIDEDGFMAFWADCDADGYAASGALRRDACAAPPAADTGCSGGVWVTRDPAVEPDCDDAAAGTYPGATEVVGDGIDQSCDGQELCYADGDSDGYRTASTVISTDSDCDDSGEALASVPAADCDDSSATVFPGATEVPGDEVDQSCDGQELCFVDGDSDGYRTTSTVTSTDTDCGDAMEASASVPAGDCNDANGSIRPGATEIVGDEVDQNCDGRETCYRDADNDNYRLTSTVSSSDVDCRDSGEAYRSQSTGDCNDNNSSIRPGVAERTGDEVDQNCDGREQCYRDLDNDGYRTTGVIASADLDCRDSGEARGSEPSGDCNDGLASIRPGAPEIVGDQVDQNCDGREVCYRDGDNDNYRTSATVASSDLDCVDGGEARSIEPAGDCCDSDPDARPNQTAYFSSSTNCGGYDYNCDGTAARRYTRSRVNSCAWGVSGCNTSSSVEGWRGATPACGVLAAWNRNCHMNGFLSCSFDSSTRRQECR